MLIGATFTYVYNMGLKCPISGSFWAPKKVKILVFGHFLKKFSLASHQYCFTCSLQVLLDGWRIWASETQFLGPQINKNSGLWSFSKKFPLVSHQSSCTRQFDLLLEVWSMAGSGGVSRLLVHSIEAMGETCPEL